MKDDRIWRPEQLNEDEKKVLSEAIEKVFTRDDNRIPTIDPEYVIEWNGKRYDKRYAKWYALQHESSDAWDDGTYDREEAIKRLLESDEYNLIAVVKDDFCVEEIRKEDL